MHTTRGIVLLSALIYLLMITMLVITAVQIGILQLKTAANFSDRAHSFLLAEKNLTTNEQNIARSICVAPDCKIISQAICGVIFYQVEAIANYHDVRTTLRSTYTALDKTAKCSQRSMIKSGRQSWRTVALQQQ